MELKPINFAEKFNCFDDRWSPKVIAEMNDYQFKLVKIEGEFVWHAHLHTDETFIVLEGEMTILFEKFEVKLQTGEMYVVPKGVLHKPVAQTECKIMIVEPKGVVNTGSADGELTAANDIYI